MQKKIRREVNDLNKDLSDDMEKGGAEAGKRAGRALSDKFGTETEKGAEKAMLAFEKELKTTLAAIDRNLKPIKPKFESNEIRKQIADVRGEIADLRKEADKGLDVKSYRQLGDRLRILQAHAAGLNNEMSELQQHDMKKANAGLDGLIKRMDSVRKAAEVEIAFDTTPAERKLSVLEKRGRATAKKVAGFFGDINTGEVNQIRNDLEALSEVNIGVDMDATEFTAKLRQLEIQLYHLATSGAEIDVAIAAGQAEAELATLNALVRNLDGKDVDIDVKTNGAAKAAAELGLLRGAFGGASSAGESAANSFRSFNIVVLALAGLLPVIVPMIGALGGGLLGLLPILGAVGAGMGAMFVGFSGIGDAVTGLGDVESEAAKTSVDNAKTMQSAADGVADAKRSLADAERNAARASEDAARQTARAREDAARSIEDALDRQREAQEAYRDSVKDVREAEADLREARKRAAEELRANKDDISDRLRQGNLAIREAQLAAFDATNTYNSVMADGSSTTYDKEKANVAMLQAREALHELREAQEELTKEQKKGAKAKVSDDSKVQSAESALERALDAQTDAQKRLGEAAEDVARARIEGAQRVGDALRNQRRAEEDGARSVARAQEALARANRGYGEALQQTGEIGSASMQRLEEAMDKLGPAGRRFALFIFGLQKGFVNLRREVQEQMLPGVQKGLENVIGYYGPRFTGFVAAMGGVVGAFAVEASEALTTAPWTDFFSMMNDLAPVMAANFNSTLLNWFTGFAAILTAVAPYSLMMSEGFLKTSEAFAGWAASQAGVDAVGRLMDYFVRVGPQVTDFLGSFWWALVAIGKAVAPWGELIMGALTHVLDFIAAMDPKDLGLIVSGTLAVAAAFQVAAGAIALSKAGAAVWAFWGGRLIFVALAIAGIMLALGVQYESFGKIIQAVTGWVREHSDFLGKLAGAVFIVVGAYKAMRLIMAIVAGVQLGLAAATYGAVGATYAQGFAAKATYTALRLWRTALLLGAAAQWLLNASLYAFPLTWIVIALVAVGVALFVLWKKSQTFRKIVLGVWSAVKQGAKLLWIGLKAYFKLIWTGWSTVFKYMRLAWRTILWPVLKVIGKIVFELWKLYFRVAFSLIRAGWRLLWATMKKVWNNGGREVFAKVKEGLEGLRDKFVGVVDRIQNIWERLKDILATPIRFFLETVMNDGLIKGWNKFAKLVGADTIDNIPIPGGLQKKTNKSQAQRDGNSRRDAFATGGILPGYTPGRDVHHFTSPTAGNLHLSGGEAIMRPEFTSAVGSGWVAMMNAAARRGAGAVRRLLAGSAFAKGGVFWPTDFRSLSDDYPGHTGVDISIPGSADYGRPVYAAHAGRAVNRNYGSSSYGNSVWIDGNGMSTIYGHLSKALVSAIGTNVKAGQQIGNIGSTGNSTGPHLHFEVRPGGTRAAALAYLSGAYNPTGGSPYNGKPGEGDMASFPKALRAMAKAPTKWAKGLFSDKMNDFRTKFAGAEMVGPLASMLSGAVTPIRNKAIGLLPAPLDLMAKSAAKISGKVAGAVKDAAGALDAVGGSGGLPYNGTMKYDSGGYLPPGLTNVVNLTGKPEPVFTHDQFSNMGNGEGGGVTIAPVFQGSNLTADEIMDELVFLGRKARFTGPGTYGKRF